MQQRQAEGRGWGQYCSSVGVQPQGPVLSGWSGVSFLSFPCCPVEGAKGIFYLYQSLLLAAISYTVSQAEMLLLAAVGYLCPSSSFGLLNCLFFSHFVQLLRQHSQELLLEPLLKQQQVSLLELGLGKVES